MRVLLVNGSPHEHGCTDTALREIASAIEAEGLETEFFWIGISPSMAASAAGAAGTGTASSGTGTGSTPSSTV